MDSDDTSSHYAVSIRSYPTRGNEAFNLLDVRVLWVHEYLEEVLGHAGGSLGKIISLHELCARLDLPY